MKVCVVGCGYVGLPTAALCAVHHDVLGYDIDSERVVWLNTRGPVSQEPGVSQIVEHHKKRGVLRFSTEPEPADVFIIAVPTPIRDDSRADCRALHAAVASIAPLLVAGNLVIIESTIPPFATAEVAGLLAAQRADLYHCDDFTNNLLLAYCPEPMLPGHALEELSRVPRLIGGFNEASTTAARQFYASITIARLHCTTHRVAELTKLVENASRDVGVAFANEVYDLSRYLGVDGREVIRLANLHPRVNILNPGIGVGGHCIPVDPHFLTTHRKVPDASCRLMIAARGENAVRPLLMANRVQETVSHRRSKYIHHIEHVAFLGLTYKPDSDDLRNSPACEIVELVARASSALDFSVSVVDPHIRELPLKLTMKGVQLVTMEEACERADLFVALVLHSCFRDREAPFPGALLDLCGLLEHYPDWMLVDGQTAVTS